MVGVDMVDEASSGKKDKQDMGVCGGDVKDKVDPDVEIVLKTVENLNLSENDEHVEEQEEDEQDAPLNLRELPLLVQRRIRALRKNQMKIIDIETNFYNEMHQLEIKYEKLYKAEFDFRNGVITGKHEPTDEESDFPLEAGVDETIPDPAPPLGDKGTPEKVLEPGVPMFWATVLQSIEPISSLIEEADLPVLEHLIDIRYENTTEPLGFNLFFHFSPNEYFENDVLVKTYIMKNDPDIDDPFTYEGPEIISCKGCTINWKAGKDTTTSVVEKRQKHKKNGTIRTITKTLKMNSVFNFFNPPEPSGAEVNEDQELDIVETLNVDFEIGQTIRERIIPRAVLFFTGEALEDETEYATDSEDEDDDDENPESESGDEVDEQGDQRIIN